MDMAAVEDRLGIEYVPIGKLQPFDGNPRKISEKGLEKLQRSVEEFGFVNPILAQRGTNMIIAGHQRLKAAKAAGLTEVPVVWLDMDDVTAKAYNIADNRLQDEAEWDFTPLADLLTELDTGAFDLSLTGFDTDELEQMMNYTPVGEVQEDEVPEPPAEAVTKPGDIWLLGNHRLMCGDSTKDEDFEKLMEGCHAQMAVTSPPYGVGKEYEKAGIEPWFETVRPVIRNLCRYADIVCWNLDDLYATGSQFIEPTSVYSVNMFLDNGYRPIWIRIWKKQGQNFGVGPYHLVSNKPVQQYEYISAFSNKGEVEEYNDQEYVWLSAFAGHSYKFVKRLTKEERKKWGYAGIWEMTTVRANKEHPAMFPVELPRRCIKMHSDKGGIVLEPFSGSGTTIIAAEQTERKCYAMELSPVYCDLAVKRWEQLTGKKAELVR